MLVALADMKNDTHHYVVQRLFSIGDINSKATQVSRIVIALQNLFGNAFILKICLILYFFGNVFMCCIIFVENMCNSIEYNKILGCLV